MMIVIVPLIRIIYDMTGTHHVTKWIIVLLFVFMLLLRIVMQKQKK